MGITLKNQHEHTQVGLDIQDKTMRRKTKIKYDRPLVGVGVFVVMRFGEDFDFLVSKRLSSHGIGLYSLPGGHLEGGESFEECCKREVKEEVGIEIDNIVQLPYVENNLFPKERKHYITLFFCAKYREGTITNMEPTKQGPWKWVSPATLPKKSFEGLKQACKVLVEENKKWYALF